MSADIARTLSLTPAASEDASPPLRLLVDGLDADEQSSLQAILDVLARKLSRQWVAVEGAEAELYLHTRGARRSGIRATLTALLVREDETQAPVDALWMPVPLRVMAVLDLLQGAHDRLGLAPAEVIPASDPSAAHDDKGLAFSLARIFVGAVEHSLRVRILGFGTLYVCPARASYIADFEPARMQQALEAKRFVLTAISPSSIEMTETDKQAHPLEALMWTIGLMTPRERARHGRHRVRLRQWPDFANLPHDPRHLQACAALSTTPMDLTELVAVTGLGELQADRFLHACELCGLVEPVPDAAPAPVRQQAAGASFGGLFDRLWRRLIK